LKPYQKKPWKPGCGLLQSWEGWNSLWRKDVLRSIHMYLKEPQTIIRSKADLKVRFEGLAWSLFRIMVTVLGTSLQNKDILTYFFRSSWNAVELWKWKVRIIKSNSIGFKNQKKYSLKCKVLYVLWLRIIH
jgi:hypothetical protein